MLVRQDIEDALDYMDRHNLIRLSNNRNTSSGWIQLHCPFHNNGQERRPSCGCSLDYSYIGGNEFQPGFFHCFSCNASYPFPKAIKEILALKGTSIEMHPDLKPYLEDTSNVDNSSLIPGDMMAGIINKYAVEDLRTRTLVKTEYVPEEELASYRFTVPYMYQRKLTDEVIERYDVGFDGNYKPGGRKKPIPCITFPCKNAEGKTLFICRRSIEGKFFYMPTNIEKSVYGIYELPPNTKEVIVCESVFNALTCVVYGKAAVALFGTGTTTEINQLKKLGVASYVLCLDNDEAGLKGTAKLKKALFKTAIVWTMHVPEGKDVNDLTKEEFDMCYANRD